ncbi:hypothetical protein QD840_001690 [Citrobacter koseri]|nr:hypothetical protein [Citrobacter koseri]ELG4624344.1 hypothetical protein [Citrobacter koseri]EMD6813335.1 hypothetical protein [Citrobacter koseri]HEM8504847.1 hypothetical protein [Citrobacter koseri]HEM8571452.1 hypothetical protein [Citrobacter koseri]
MNKYEGVTVVCLTKDDYNGDELKPAAHRAVDTADIVTDTGLIIKNRVAGISEVKTPAKKTSKSSDISNELFDAELIAAKLGGMIDLANQHFFTDEDEDNLQYVMFAVLDDYAGQMRNILQEIKSKVAPCNG